MPAEFQRVKEIFLAAVEKAGPAEREACLDEACGDDETLRKQVEALVRKHEEAGSFLQSPVIDPAVTVDPQPSDADSPLAPPGRASPGERLTEAAGSRIGPYKLLQQIGEGGMGTVWMAEQTQPVQRKVALKLIKSGMDSRQVIARFEAERQALALMDHPNIARVLDAGETPPAYAGGSPRPYFVMELVKGVPITRYCDEHHLTPRERLELFVPVCQAVQHAHQKGTIHRDLKPSNVMVCLYDGKPVPKIIDFGIAKATGSRLTEKTLFTELGQVVGTLEYMSPEQAELNQLDIDTRSDIYSLGVLLYELLTGTTPLERKRFQAVAFLEVLRLIREEESPRPSTRLSTSEGLPSIAANRGLEPKKLSGLVRGELDWIVMKTLEKDRNRRYETANGLAMDVQRYLADEAVQACPPSTAYRLKKILRRNKGPALAGLLVLLVLVGGIIGTTLGLLRAEAARANEAQARQRAETARDHAAATLYAMTSSLAGNALTQQKVLTPEQKRFLTTALNYYREVLKEHETDEAARKRIAAAALRVGIIEIRLGRRDEAAAMFRQARDLYTQLAGDFPAVAEYRQKLAESHHRLATPLVDLAKWDEAEPPLRAAVALRQQLVAEFPASKDYRHDLAHSHHILGDLLRQVWKPEEAEKEFRTALDIRKKLLADFPGVAVYRLDLANHHSSLGHLLADWAKWASATSEYRAALVLRKELAAEFPFDPTYRQALADGHNGLGNVLTGGVGKFDEAETEFRAALIVRRQLAADFPAAPKYVLELGGALCNIGFVMMKRGRLEESLPLFEEAIATLSPLVRQEPRLTVAREFLRNSHWARAETLDKLRRHDKAVGDWARTLELAPRNRNRIFQHGLMLSRARAGQVEAALADADRLATGASQAPDPQDFNLKDLNPRDLLYDCACVYGLAHAKTKDDKQAARAVELLRQAVAKGFRNAAHLKKDGDLASLRTRDDFKKLLAELTKGP